MQDKDRTNTSLIRTSIFLSRILRHRPQDAGITLDEHGWANVDELLAGVSKTHPLTREQLEEIVRINNKQRFSFSEDHTRIRANQGHSIPVDVELPVACPPDILYHGTTRRFSQSIEEKGLLHGNRLYVHMTADPSVARKRADTRGNPIIYGIRAADMDRDGYTFCLSVNGVWLTEHVPPQYLFHADECTADE